MLHNDRQQGTVPGPRDGARTRAARHRPGGGVPARQPNVAAPLDQLRPAALLPRRWRRERRFRRADLLAFLERTGEPAPAPHAGHLCGLYTSGAARERQAAAFLAKGLEAEGTCFLAAEPTVRKRVLAGLARDWPAAPAAARSGRLVVSRYARLPAAQLEYWEAGFADARRAGAGELRVVGDISGERLGRHRSFGDLLVYERDYGALARRFGVATLCLYDARRLSGVQAARMLQVHTDMLRETPADVSP